MAKSKKNSKKQKGKSIKSNNSTLKFFVLFATIALLTIIILEYLDFQKGEKSFIFTKIIPLERLEEKTDRFNKKLTAILTVNKIPYDYFVDNDGKFHFKLDIDEYRFPKFIDKINSSVSQLNGKIELPEIQDLDEKAIMLYKVSFVGKVTHLLLISKLKPISAQEKTENKEEIREPVVKPASQIIVPKHVKEKTAKGNLRDEASVSAEEPTSGSVKPSEPVDRTPRIAIIIDDMGAYETSVQDLNRLGIPITASILPDSRRAANVVRDIRENGDGRVRALIHIPMQPENSSAKNYDPDQVITMNSTDEQIRSMIHRAKQIVPIADGANNHEGSRVTSDRNLMARILGFIKQEGLFFIDSRTTAKSTAYNVAKEMDVRTAHRDVFLDHVQEYSESLSQIRILVDLALRNGKAIAIGHPFESTLRAIRDSKQYIESKGVKIVFVKDLIE